MSRDPPTIDASLARRLIDSQFPQWSDLAIRPVELDGWDNRSFRLGSELTIRLPTGDWYAQQVDKEQRWLPVLAPQLPLPIPVPVARGEPEFGFPYPWSVYRWLDGEPASSARIGELAGFATALARFLNALGRVDATGGPAPGQHNFYRGDPLGTYAGETFQAIDALAGEVPVEAVKRVWDDAMTTSWERAPVWFHGDVATGNLLVRDGRLAAVLDFGSSGVGDPACDTVIAWTFLSGASRDRFRAELGVDSATWSRGRGWALWKALISLVGQLENDSPDAALARRDIEQVLADYAETRLTRPACESPGPAMAHVLSVNVGRPRPVDTGRRTVLTAIWKASVEGRVAVRGVNVDGDDQADRSVHGGPDKAVYAYAIEETREWEAQLGRELGPGAFGENLTVEGIDVSGALVGERWRVGTSVLEVVQPRFPCFKLGLRMGDPSFVKRFGDASRPGAYLRIVEEGELGAGDTVEVDVASLPDHGVTMRLVSDAILLDRGLIPHVLEAPQLIPSLREWMTDRLSRAGPEQGRSHKAR